MYYKSTYLSRVGLITLACSDTGLAGLWLEGQKYHGGAISEAMTEKDTPVLNTAKRWLDRYFAGEKPNPLELPLAPVGSEFRQNVWSILCEIPYGEVITYGDIAAVLIDRKSVV